MRAGRLIAEILRLQQQGPTTAEVLARELEVSVRTIYRDVAELQAAGVPVWTETGPHGGIRLVEGWGAQLGTLTGTEADALLLGSAPAAAQLGLGSVLAAAQSKVRSTLPPELRARGARVTERFFLDAPGWFTHEESLPHLPAVASAVWSERRIDIRYQRRPDDPLVARRLDPLGLVQKGGAWYLVARHRREIRTYRVDRCVAVSVRQDTFERPAGFDLESWWHGSAAAFDRSLLRSVITVRLDERCRRQLGEVFGTTAAGAIVARPELDGGEPDGWRAFDLPVESEEVAAHQLLQLGTHAEVVAPASLRQRMAETGRMIATRHGATRAAR
jgi:predicted DNA-binding transcriptional regulator YafY